MQKIDRIGEQNRAKNGLMMTIIEYRNSTNIDIQFEDGFIVYHKTYSRFLSGMIGHPKYPAYTRRNNLYMKKRIKTDRIGQTNTASNGMILTIIAYRHVTDIDVQFEDGAIVTHVRYDAFKNGRIPHPSGINNVFYKTRQTNIGRTTIHKYGIPMEVVEYKGSHDINVLFGDGYLAEHKYMGDFNRQNIGHPFPYILNNISMDKPAYVINNVGNFYCHCPICGYKDIMTIDEIKNFRCTHE